MCNGHPDGRSARIKRVDPILVVVSFSFSLVCWRQPMLDCFEHLLCWTSRQTERPTWRSWSSFSVHLLVLSLLFQVPSSGCRAFLYSIDNTLACVPDGRRGGILNVDKRFAQSACHSFPSFFFLDSLHPGRRMSTPLPDALNIFSKRSIPSRFNWLSVLYIYIYRSVLPFVDPLSNHLE